MLTSDFDYDLPPQFIAQTPVEPRDHSRLLVLDRANGEMQQAHFYDLGKWLRPGDLLVLNETRVIPARVFARKPTGGRVELLLLHRLDALRWESLVGGKGLKAGVRLELDHSANSVIGSPGSFQGNRLPGVEITAVLDGARRELRFDSPVEPYLVSLGHMPLPPYIHTPLIDPERYQTVYARTPGSAAAPTAGLHFTPRLMDELKNAGIGFAAVTLHVGLDTFAPVTEDDPRQHVIHTELCTLHDETAQAIRRAKAAGGRVIAVGTTSVRTLESAARRANHGEIVASFDGPTDLFILPGEPFRLVDAMITNFHLPRSTLIMLVSAFAGREQILRAYEYAKQHGYRFYSFGDAMLIL